MTRTRSALLALPLALVTLAACGSDSKTATTNAPSASVADTAAPATPPAGSAAPDTAASDSTPAATAGGTGAAAGTVNLADSALGSILVDGDGRTLYLFMNDTPTAPACTGGCLAKWPPLVAAGTTTPGAGLSAEDFGTVTAGDGSTQVTFYGHPLYYFAADANPGDTNGQGVGGVWYVVDGEGNAVK